MPYKIDPKNKKCVVKADTGTKVGCTKGSVKKYLAALHANVKDIKESEEFEWFELKNLPEKNDFISQVKYALEGSNYELKCYTTGELNNGDEYNLIEICEIVYKLKNQKVLQKAKDFFTPQNIKKELDEVLIDERGRYSNDVVKKIYTDLYELLKPILSEDINESEEDEFEWARATVKDSFLKYMGKEIMIDIQGLNQDELKKLYNIILPYVQQNDKAMFINDEDEEIYWGDNLKCFENIIQGDVKKKAISIHCGLEDNEYRPLKGAICCLNSTYEDEPNKENIIPINARELIGDTIKESEEFDWVPKEVDLNDHRVLYLIIEDTLKNSNFKIVKEGDVYHIEDEYGDIYFYISERDFNLPFIYHEIKDSIQFLKYEDDNEMLPYYQKLMGLLSPLYKNNIDKLFKPIKESEEWYDEVLNEKPLIRFDDLMVGDVVTNIDPNKLDNLGENDIYFHVDSFKEGTTYRNGYAEKEDFAVISLMKKNPETGNYYGVSRETINFPKGNNKPIWTLIYRENVLEESEWFEDVVNDPIMLKVEDLEMGDIVIPTCVKDGEYIVMSKGTSVKLLDAPTHWVTLKRHTKANTGGIFIEHDTEIGKNCRFKLIHRENDIIGESEEDEFNWAEDIIANTTEEIDITNDFDLWENKLVEGSVVKITGRWEDIYFEDDIATIVNPADEAGNSLLKFDRVIYEFGDTDEGNHTHCGENETQNIKCECQRKQNNRDEVGKCWWTNLRQMEKIIYLPFEGKQITESEEDEFNWVEDITKYLKVGQKFKVKTSAEPLIVQIVRIVKKMDFNRNTIYFSPIKLVNTKYPGVPMNVQRLMTHINNGSWTPINDIKESEEDSELFWAEDLLDFNNPINITDKLDIMEELPVDSILKIEGHQDGMSLENDECQLIQKGHSASSDRNSTYCLFKFKDELRNDDDEPTHCGNKPIHQKICECRETMEGEYAPDGRVGKCWWVQLGNMNRVIYYTNRLGISENKDKKPLLTEGRYDAITRKVVRDIMKVVTEGNSDSYNLPLDISGEQEYEQDNLNFNLELEIVRTDEDVQTFEVRTAIADEDDENIVMMTIILGSKFSSQNLEKLFYKLQEDIRHEIEHLTQIGPNRIEDRPTYKGSTANLKTVYGHHKNVIEVPALVHGFYRRAKLEKRPLDEIMTDDLDSEIEKGLLTKKQAQKLLTIWLDYAKKNLPSAIYKEN
jgi:hypothetical protein